MLTCKACIVFGYCFDIFPWTLKTIFQETKQKVRVIINNEQVEYQ